MTFTITKDKVGAFLKQIEHLTKKRVLIGVPDTNAARREDDGAEGEPLTNAVIGYIHEFGAPEANIPPRPHLVPGVDSIKDKAAERLKSAARQAADGDLESTDRAFHAIGLTGQNAVRAKIADGSLQPLAEATLKARRSRGRKGTNPLVDSGQYRKSITYVIRDKGS